MENDNYVKNNLSNPFVEDGIEELTKIIYGSGCRLCPQFCEDLAAALERKTGNRFLSGLVLSIVTKV